MSTAAASLFHAVEMAPRDPILGVTEAFAADTHADKVNLGVGVYTGEDGKVPLLDCVRRAEAQLVAAAAPRSYLPIDGLAAYDRAVQQLVFGATSDVVASRRAVTVQALGGTGGLRIGADLLRRVSPGAKIWISDPSWENHRALFEAAGSEVRTYPYHDPRTRGLDFDGMRAALATAPAGDVVVLHACCHNPTGVDLSDAQWDTVIDIVRDRGLVPFLDIAYQGFGDGLEADAAAVRRFAATGLPMLVSNSFSKSFSLYGERVGALSVVAASADEAARVLSQLKRIVRTNYSNPPTHGSKVVAAVLDTPEVRALWDEELGRMRDRIKQMRQALAQRLAAALPQQDHGFVVSQRGMFSYTGLTRAQVERLRTEHSVYAVDTGRICVAALNLGNIDHVAAAMAAVQR
ncbi:MAG: aspartate/tyrosine/aromatic aminotransferase [Burkholderiales bacterium]|nr:aspartate/tyrosine/aromatic aminotransferase [Burkholderiales bacterium]